MWQGYQLLAFEWAMVLVTFVMVAIRLWVQISFRARPWQEVLVVSAWLLFLGTAIGDSIINDLDGNTPEEVELPISSVDTILKIEYSQSYIYKLSIYLCKGALLLFYCELSPRHYYFGTWLFILITGVLVAIGAIVQLLYAMITCTPFPSLIYVKTRWHLDVNSCTSDRSYFIVNWAFHLGTDILVYLIPFLILYYLKNLNRQQKLGAGLMFSVGFINILSAAGLLTLSLVKKESKQVKGFHNCLFTIQQFTAIAVVCLPQMRKFIGDQARRKSSVSSMGLRDVHEVTEIRVSESRKASAASTRDRELSVGRIQTYENLA